MRYLTRMPLRKIALLFAIILFGASTTTLAQNRPSKSDINFLYAFGAHMKPQGGGKVVPVQTESTLHSGDRLKLFFEPKSDLNFYLLHLSSQGELTPLYPLEAKPARVAPGTQVFIPAGNQWFELDAHPGQEKFFLIAAMDRLERLEELCARHATLTNTADLQSSAAAILNEIKQLRQQYQQLTAPAEKPVRIGGSLRGQQSPASPVDPDITPLAAEVTAAGFYSRTFSIDHR